MNGVSYDCPLTYGLTSHERIACVSWRTRANGIVVDNFTTSGNSTGAKTWISTLLIGTCLISVAIRIYYTFWSAGRRTTNEARNT